MRQVRIIATGATVSEADYRAMHPLASFANVFTPFDDAELLPEVPDVPSDEEIRAAFKVARAAAVAAIVVTVDGMQFDGDETSQGRMARAIIAMEAAGVDSTTWVLATNVPTSVTLAQLKQALIAAGLAQSALWVQE